MHAIFSTKVERVDGCVEEVFRLGCFELMVTLWLGFSMANQSLALGILNARRAKHGV